MGVVRYVPATSQQDLQQIIALQECNQPRRVPKQRQGSEGFVTVVHELSLLEQMNRPYPHVLAKTSEGQLAGYALVMLKEFADEIPVLVPMFQAIDQQTYQGRSLADTPYFVMGQVCVAEKFRGKGIFRGLYQALRQQMQPHFPLVITEVATRNVRSLQAHHAIGFQPLHFYHAFNEDWEIMFWDWRYGLNYKGLRV